MAGYLAFQIVAGATVDLIRHNAPQQQVALAAEIEHLRVGQRRLAVACVIGFVVDHFALLGGIGVPVNLSQLCGFGNGICRLADFGRTAESDLDGWRVTTADGTVCRIGWHRHAPLDLSSPTHVGEPSGNWIEVILAIAAIATRSVAAARNTLTVPRRMRSWRNGAGRR